MLRASGERLNRDHKRGMLSTKILFLSIASHDQHHTFRVGTIRARSPPPSTSATERGRPSLDEGKLEERIKYVFTLDLKDHQTPGVSELTNHVRDDERQRLVVPSNVYQDTVALTGQGNVS